METTVAAYVPRTFDAVLAVVTVGFGVLGVWSELREAAWVPPPAVGGYLIAVAAAGLLLWRRRLPAAVGILAVCALYHELGYPGYGPAVAMAVAVYLMAAHGSGWRSLAAATTIVVLLTVVPMLPPHPAEFSGAVYGPLAAMVAGAAVGEASRARRVAATEQLRSVRRAAAEEAHLRVIQERLGIAREVHDVLAHTITVIAVQAAAAADALDERPEETRVALAAVRRSAKEAMAELRGTLALLRAGESAPVAPQPTLDQLPQLVEQAGAAGVAVQLDVDAGTATLPTAVQLVAYRIVQEALTNTVRHSRARSATVRIAQAGAELVVAVTDGGPPIESAPDIGGHGLIGMRERVTAIGGTIDTGPAGASGFRVLAHIPTGVGR